VLGPFTEPEDAVAELVSRAADAAQDTILGRREL
jgi:hypothetical protein